MLLATLILSVCIAAVSFYMLILGVIAGYKTHSVYTSIFFGTSTVFFSLVFGTLYTDISNPWVIFLSVLVGPWSRLILFLPDLGLSRFRLSSFLAAVFSVCAVLIYYVFYIDCMLFAHRFLVIVIHLTGFLSVIMSLKPVEKRKYGVSAAAGGAFLYLVLLLIDMRPHLNRFLSLWFLLWEIYCGAVVLYLSVVLFHAKGRTKTSSFQLADSEKKLWKERIDSVITDESVYCDPEYNLDKLAAEFSVSRFVLSKVINTVYGCRFNDLLNDRRIERSKQLILANSGMTILEAAFSSGFNSKSTFNRVFRQKMGISPLDFKKKSIIS